MPGEQVLKKRRKARVIQVGSVKIGGNEPIVVQSMANTDTRDIEATVRQIHELQEAGCEIVRVAVLDEEAVEAIPAIKKRIQIPLIADIHFPVPFSQLRESIQLATFHFIAISLVSPDIIRLVP